MTSLKDRIDMLCSKRHVKPDYSLNDATVAIMDDSDGRGAYIGMWNETMLGAFPMEEDGFTADELRRGDSAIVAVQMSPKPVPSSDWSWGPTFVEVVGEG